MGVGAAETYYRKFGPKGNDGLVKPAFKAGVNKIFDSAGFEKPFTENPKNTSNQSENVNDGKPTNGTNSEQKNGVHNKSPHTKSKKETDPFV